MIGLIIGLGTGFWICLHWEGACFLVSVSSLDFQIMVVCFLLGYFSFYLIAVATGGSRESVSGFWGLTVEIGID